MKTENAIRARDAGDCSNLLCPRCGSEQLHHVVVEVFDRSEDEPTLIKTTANMGRGTSVAEVSSAGSGNPSSRRDGVRILFRCETCGDDPIYLNIAQHKGSTEISWLFEPSASVAARYRGDKEFGQF